MSSRNQNRAPRSPSSKKVGTGEVPFDKRRKVGIGRAVSRQPFADVNGKKDGTANPDAASTEGSENVIVVFTKEEVDALLNEKPKTKKFDLKGNMQQMTEKNKRLKQCIRWFQQSEQGHLLEQETLRKALESAEKKCIDTENEKEKQVEELNVKLAELKNENASLQEQLAKESSEKLEALNSYRAESEARVAAERVQASLAENLEKVQQEKVAVEQQVASVKDMHRSLEVYNKNLHDYNSQLQNHLETANASLSRVEKEKSAIVENLCTLRVHYKSSQEQLTSSRASLDEAVSQKDALKKELNCLQQEIQMVRCDRDSRVAEVKALSDEIARYKEATGRSVIELDNLTIKTQALQDTCSSQAEQMLRLQQQLAAANEQLKMSDLSAIETRTLFEEQKKAICEMQTHIADLELQVIEGENLRKKLHNTIQELKGNIRVFCRVRPLLPDDGVRAEPVVSYPTSAEGLGRGIDLIQTGQKYPFTFDKVFSQEASQQDIFLEISQLVQSALDGYKVSIFAYGQTGSGKTYTMMGKPGASDKKGLIPRSLEQIFQTSQALTAQGWKYKLQASMLEIYNETIRDLLLPSRSNGLDLVRSESGVVGKQYTIKHDANGNTYVSDLTIVDVCSVSEITLLLQQAEQCRSVGKTQMNEQSSRSHFVFTLRISGVNETTEQQVQGVLNLIDLAGSERLSKSGATGDRLKETQAINKSLSSLADVIFALAKKEDHVPFRNSKLTYLLQPCLGGDSKTLMFVNISPEQSSAGESLCSLRFAARVNACEIGIPRRQTTMRPLDSRLSYG